MTLDEIYAALPKVECRQLCADQCSIILIVPEELRRMTVFLGHEPRHAAGCLDCPALDAATKTCNAYDARPFICRLWGVSSKMPCPHGCKPDRELSPSEERRLLFAYEKHHGPLDAMPGLVEQAS